MAFYDGSLASLRRGAVYSRGYATSRPWGEAGEQFFTSLETVGSAFAFGIWGGYRAAQGGALIPFIGVRADLAVGIAAHLWAFWGSDDRMRAHWTALGNGALASFASTLGTGLGNTWKTTGKLFGGMKGIDRETTGGSSLADEALSSFVRPA